MKAAKSNAIVALSSVARRWVRTSDLLCNEGGDGLGLARGGSVVLLRCLGLAGCRKQALAGRCQDHGTGVADVGSVFGLSAFDRHFVSNVQGIARPAGSHQGVGATHLHTP